MARCKKGFKKVGNACVSNKDYKRFGKFSYEMKVIKLAFIGALSSIGGWAMFQGVVDLTKIDKLHPLIMIFAGIIIIFCTYKFGFAKMK